VNWDTSDLISATLVNWRLYHQKFMHFDYEKDPVETGVQGQCTNYSRFFWVALIVHALRNWSLRDCAIFRGFISLLNISYPSQELHIGIKTWRDCELTKLLPWACLWVRDRICWVLGLF